MPISAIILSDSLTIQISKVHNFLTFSCSVTFFSTLSQPPSVMANLIVTSPLYLWKPKFKPLIFWPQLLTLFLQLPHLVTPPCMFFLFTEFSNPLMTLLSPYLYLSVFTSSHNHLESIVHYINIFLPMFSITLTHCSSSCSGLAKPNPGLIHVSTLSMF